MKTIVLGAGAAGLWCALHAAERGPVVILAPDPTGGSATALAQGGIAAAIAEGDDPRAHAADTFAAGAGLCDPEAVRVLTDEAPEAIAELRHRGMVFDAGGAPTLEGGHSARRILHAGGDATGRVLLRALLDAVAGDARIDWEDGRAVTLLGDRAVHGVRTETAREVEADRVVLATGGACGIFGRRTGPGRATGQGMALAWRAGAVLADLEFVQFHPTALNVEGKPARLLTEALRGEGAVLVDDAGRRFMDEFDPRGDLAPRDIVARAIVAVRERTGGRVFLDATRIERVAERFPTASASCAEAGLDLARERIPVGPAAHYFIGGVLTDAWGRSSLPGLLACGEAACTGVHGANRLASNSLLETLVFGRRAALAEEGAGPRIHPNGAIVPTEGTPTLAEVRGLADHHLGVSRTGPDLEAVAAKLSHGAGPGATGGPEARVDRDADAAALIARLVALAALRRQESRGTHFRVDRPELRPEWILRQALTPDGWAALPVTS